MSDSTSLYPYASDAGISQVNSQLVSDHYMSCLLHTTPRSASRRKDEAGNKTTSDGDLKMSWSSWLKTGFEAKDSKTEEQTSDISFINPSTDMLWLVELLWGYISMKTVSSYEVTDLKVSHIS